MNWNEEARIDCHFLFKCPQRWDRLQPTAEERVRRCTECDRDVHLALTEEEFIRHREADHCIAVPVLWPERQVDPDGSQYVVGRADPPYGPESEPR